MNEINLTNADFSEFQNIYSPSTLLGVYANAIRSSVDGKIVIAKGIYQMNPNQKEYSGYYYDEIKTQNDNRSIRAKVPSLLRSKLHNNSVYILKGFIEKRINFSSIELVFVIDEILKKEEKQISDEELRRFNLIQQKVSKGFQDLEALIKKLIYKGELINIANLYGNTAIVHKDFEKGLAEASKHFKITNYRCNFSSKSEIIQNLLALSDKDFHVIAIVRGGGEKASLEIFNDSEVGAGIIKAKPIMVSALGHTVDETLSDKLVDKSFAVPLDYGNKLKVWVDNALEEQSKSKSIFIEQVKKDLSKTFQDQITTLQNQILTRNKEFEDNQQKFKIIIEQNQKDKIEAIQSKEKAFDAQVKSFTEQIKIKDEYVVKLQSNYDNTTKLQINAAIADMKSKYEIVFNENNRLNKQIKEISNKSNQLVYYIIIAVIVGIIIGAQLK